ncbi:MAG: hypothetical protein WBY24_07340 [Candidatus Acidiferrales bacterium]
MRFVIGAVLLVALPLGLGEDSYSGAAAGRTTDTVTIYDPNPAQLWNQLHAVFYIREDLPSTREVSDALDPPLWDSTQYLLEGPSHQRVVRVLDEFLQTHGERLIRDPVKRAVLQRDLWAVFDWTVAREPNRPGEPAYEKERLELQTRLAEVLRRLALSPEEIRALPENYAEAVASGQFAKEYDPRHRDRPFLPPDLLDPLGPWVAVYGQGPSSDPVAVGHVSTFSRSSFLVFMRLPGGRKATYDYLRTLWDFPQPWIASPDEGNSEHDQTSENPNLPQFPAGTQVALVRQLMLFDNRGNLAGTPLTESVQIRVYRTVTTPAMNEGTESGFAGAISRSGQDFYQITLSRPLLFAGKAGGLRATGRNEKEFFIFNAPGPDDGSPSQYTPLDKYPRMLESCVMCHRAAGIASLNSRSRLLKPYWLNHDYPSTESDSERVFRSEHKWWEETQDMGWKKNRYEWGLLSGYWKSGGEAH